MPALAIGARPALVNAGEASRGALRVHVDRLTGLEQPTDPWGRAIAVSLSCACEIRGRPETRFRSQVVHNTLSPVWDHVAVYEDYAPGDSLTFTIFDGATGPSGKQRLKGSVGLAAGDFQSHGFDGSLPISLAGQSVFLKVRVIPTLQVGNLQMPVFGPVSAEPPRGRLISVRRDASAPWPSEMSDGGDVAKEIQTQLAAGNFEDAMLLSCYIGDYGYAKDCFQRGASASSWDLTQKTTVFFAVASGSLPVLKVLLEHDVHREFTSRYFDEKICPEGGTLVMLALWYGNHDIYEFLVGGYGCECRLLGQRHGAGGDGRSAPLHKWLGYLPLITTADMVPRPPTIKLAYTMIEQTCEPTDQEYREAQASRRRARDWISNYLRCGGRDYRNDGPSKGLAPQAVLHRNAIQDPASLATLEELLRSIEARAPEVGEGEGSDSDNYSNEGGEVWGNSGAEFIDEKVVTRNMKIMRHSIFWHLGKLKVRELLRGVDVVSMQKSEIAFHENHPIDSVMLLVHGEVAEMQGNKQSRRLKADGRCTELLDAWAYLSKGVVTTYGVHRVTAKVASKDALFFVFSRDSVEEFCAWGGPEDLVSVAMLAASLRQVQPFSLAERSDDILLEALRSTAACVFLSGGVVLQEHGEPRKTLLIVQRGTVSLGVRGESTFKVLEVGKSKCEIDEESSQNPGGNHYHHHHNNQKHHHQDQHDATHVKFYILGLRSFLFAVGGFTSARVKSGTIQGWEVSPERVNLMLRKSDSSGRDLRQILLKNTLLHYVHKSHLFRRLNGRDPRMRRLVDDIECRDLVESKYVCQKGEKVESMMVLLEGEFAVYAEKRKKTYIRADVDQHKVHLIGEEAVLGRCYHPSTIQVRSAFATVSWVTVDHICHAFGGMDSLLQEQGLSYDQLYEQISREDNAGRAAVAAVVVAGATADGSYDDQVAAVPSQLTFRDGTKGPQPPRSGLRGLGHRARASVRGVRAMGSLAASSVVARISDATKRRKQKRTKNA